MSKRKPVRVVETPVAVADRDPRPPVEAIRAAAFTQFAERGYPVVTVRDIMKACGLTQGALSRHLMIAYCFAQRFSRPEQRGRPLHLSIRYGDAG